MGSSMMTNVPMQDAMNRSNNERKSGEGHTETLYFLRDFSVNLKNSKK